MARSASEDQKRCVFRARGMVGFGKDLCVRRGGPRYRWDVEGRKLFERVKVSDSNSKTGCVRSRVTG